MKLLIRDIFSSFTDDLCLVLFSVIPNVAGVMTNLSEELVLEKCFELLFAFDEVGLLLFFGV